MKIFSKKGILLFETLWFLSTLSIFLIGAHFTVLKFWNRKVQALDEKRIPYKKT